MPARHKGAHLRQPGRQRLTGGTFATGLLLALASAGAQALDPDKQFHHYVKDVWSIEEGLPQITVLDIAQDAEGYIWAATQAGVARFDGANFTAFNPDNTPALPGLLTHSLHLDRRGRLWIGTYKGVALYADRQFQAVAPPAGRAGVDVQTFAELQDGEILVGTPSGLFRVAGNRLVPHARLAGIPAYGLLAQGDTLWVGSSGVVYRVRGPSVEPLPLPAGHAKARVRYLAVYRDTLWLGTSEGLFRGTGRGWERYGAHPALASLPIDAMHLDGDGNFWVATNEGLARIHEGRLREFISDDNPAAHGQIKAIHEDHEGNLWLGSHWYGLARLWNGWTLRLSKPEGLHDPLVWSVARGARGELWVGTNDGLSVYRDGRFTRVARGAELPHPNAYTLLPDGERLWIGTRSGLVIHRNGELLSPALFDPMDTLQISGMLRDRQGDLWFATSGGLFRLRGSELQHYGREAGLLEPKLRVLLETRAGELLVGSQAGLYALRNERLQRLGEGSVLAPDIDVTALAELADGTLVVGTLAENELFLRLDGVWHRFTDRQGLPNNSPFFIAADAQGYLWVAGIRGLYRVPLEQFRQLVRGEIERLDAQMLLSERGDYRGSQKAYCCNGAGNAKGFMEDGDLWLPTRGGVVIVRTDEIRMNRVPPNVTLERVRYAGEWRTLLPGRELVLPAAARDLAFAFTVLSFQDPESVQLQYRLRGYDEQWKPVEDIRQRMAFYTNLPAGDYRFEVRGANNAGVWSTDTAELVFRIRPRFHETPWFYALLALLAAGLIYAGYRYQLRHLHAQRMELEALVRQRTRELEAANRRLEVASQTDQLTGLRNRRYLGMQLPADLAYFHRNFEAQGYGETAMVLGMADIDHFKRINDRYGHKAGDTILRQFAALLLEQVRKADYVVRWGGEEFLLVFRPMPRAQTARIAARVHRAVAGHRFTLEDGSELPVTCSLGFVEYPFLPGSPTALDWETIVELADHALYRVKTGGRNGWAIIRPAAGATPEAILQAIGQGSGSLLEQGLVEITEAYGGNKPED